MHTVLTRGNAILAYTLSVLACLTFCCFISTVFLDYRTNVKINTVKTLVKNVPNYGASKELHDLGFITFDLNTDLSGLFNWNVKQLFLYLTAEYKTPANELNQVSWTMSPSITLVDLRFHLSGRALGQNYSSR